MHDRKAQIQQVFIYVMAIIVIGFVVLFGYKMVNNVFTKKCSVDQQLFVSSLQRNLDRSNRFGTVSEAVLKSPCDYQQVCFVNTRHVKDGVGLTTEKLKKDYPLININTEDKLPYNVYLIEPGVNGDVYPVGYDERIVTQSPDTDPHPPGSELLCINTTAGQFRFWLEGLGRGGIYLYEGG